MMYVVTIDNGEPKIIGERALARLEELCAESGKEITSCKPLVEEGSNNGR